MHTPTDGLGASRFVAFTRDEWSQLRDQTAMTLTESDLFGLRGLNEQVTLAEVERIYLPGERGDSILEKRTRDGIPLPQGTWSRLLAAADALGVPAPSKA